MSSASRRLARSSYIDKEGMMAEEKNKIILYTTADGKRYNVIYYALEMILAVGFRVRGVRGTQKGTRRLTTSGARRRLVLPTRRIWRNCDESRRRRSNAAGMENENERHQGETGPRESKTPGI